ncbi:MAG: hypothetical protein MR694_01715 [Spirochaetia bacterium]|nr:hypothetical protein [Spirochaetia bacterium]
MFLRESLEERNVIRTMDELKTGNITSARTCRGWRIKMNGQTFTADQVYLQSEPVALPPIKNSAAPKIPGICKKNRIFV